MKVKILYTHFTSQDTAAILDQWLSFLPKSLQNINHKFANKEDKVRNILGKLLLKEGLKILDNQSASIENIKFTAFQKPYISDHIDFSISHSGNYVFCAIAENIKLGIDIEEIKPVDFNDFKHSMNKSEWFKIYNSPDPLQEFFNLWTLKEAVIKADGKGFFADFETIIIKNNIVHIENNIWFYEKINFDKNYSGHLVTSNFHTEVEMIFTRFI